MARLLCSNVALAHFSPKVFSTPGVADNTFGIENFYYPALVLAMCAVIPLLWSNIPG